MQILHALFHNYIISEAMSVRNISEALLSKKTNEDSDIRERFASMETTVKVIEGDLKTMLRLLRIALIKENKN